MLRLENCVELRSVRTHKFVNTNGKNFFFYYFGRYVQAVIEGMLNSLGNVLVLHLVGVSVGVTLLRS